MKTRIALIILVTILMAVIAVSQENKETIHVTFFKGSIDEKLEQQIFVDPLFQPNVSLADSNLIVIVNKTVDPSILTTVSEGKGLVILVGNAMKNSTLLQNLFDVVEFVEYNYTQETENSLQFNVQNSSDEIAQYITWTSAPRVKERFYLDEPKYNAEKIIIGRRMDTGEEETVIWKLYVGEGIVFIFTPIVGNGINEDMQFWPYFNYLLYAMMMEAVKKTPQKYEDWRYSPVPHDRDRLILLTVPLIVLVISFIIFYFVRQYSKRNPLKKEELGALTQIMESEEGISGWEEIGFHRQVASLLYLGILGIIVSPVAILWGSVLYGILIKYPMVQGMIDWTINLFNAIWLMFDFGTSFALVKYLSEYRVKRPEEGIKYVQFFVWWQFITGIVQVFIVTNLSAWYVVHLDIAYMSWVFITFSLIQYPGIFMVAIFVFRGLQRFDLEQTFNLVYTILFSMMVPAVFAYFYREKIATNLLFGDILNTVLGYFFGLYFGNWLFLISTIIIMKKLDIPLKAIFRVDFDLNVIKKALSFGGKSMVGDTVVAAVYSIQVLLVAKYVINYQEWQGFYSVAMGLSFIVSWVIAFTSSVLPAVSEAYSNGFKKLTQVYVVESFRYGYVILTWLIVWLALLREKLILGFLGPSWRPVIDLLLLALIFQYLGPPAWINDVIQLGAERPGLRAIFTALEQCVRLILLFVFLAIFNMQMYGVFYAYILALLTKDIFTTLITHVKIVKVKILWLHTYVMPLVAIFIIALPLNYLFNIFWLGYQGKTIILFGMEIRGEMYAAAICLIAAMSTIFIYFPILLFMGCWNEVTFRDFERAVNLLGPLRFVFIPSLIIMKKIVKISPFYKKVPQLYIDGLKEAEELMRIKRQVLLSKE